MRTEFKLITPEIAKKMIGSFSSNRMLKPSRIKAYANQMRTGQWFPETGEAIKVTKSGKMIDGNHRCHAVIEANTPIYFTVIYDIPDEAMPYLDTGLSRTGADVFTIRGIPNATRVVGIIQSYNKLKKGLTNRSQDYAVVLSNKAVLDMYLENPLHWQNIQEQAMYWYNSFYRAMSPSMIGGLYTYLSDIQPDDSSTFFTQLCTGENITNATITLLRDRIINEKTQNRKTTQMFRLALIIKAWNAFRKKREIKVLKWNSSEEEFPKAI